MSKRQPTKHEANKNSSMTTKISEYYLTQLVRKVGAKNREILLLSLCCSTEEHIS
jgi:hypothetical protein